MSPRKTKDNPLGLEPFEGEAVTEIGIEIPGAGGGFRESLDVDETLIDMLKGAQKGDTVYAVFQLSKLKVHMDPAKKHDGWRRVDIYGVDGVGVLDAETALASIEAQRERVRLAIEKAEGIQRLPMESENQDPDDAKNGGASE